MAYLEQTGHLMNTGYAIKSGSMANRQRTRDALVHHEEFKTNGALAAYWCREDAGRLPEEFAILLREAQERVGALYTVTSYATPIAWYEPGVGWTVPDVKYSTTTSAHQHVVRAALSLAGAEVDS